jgi:hypothetical protein
MPLNVALVGLQALHKLFSNLHNTFRPFFDIVYRLYIAQVVFQPSKRI